MFNRAGGKNLSEMRDIVEAFRKTNQHYDSGGGQHTDEILHEFGFVRMKSRISRKMAS